MKPWPLAVRPEELRAIRRAFRRVLPSVLVGDGSEGLGSVPEGRRSELRPYREALLLPSPPPTGPPDVDGPLGGAILIPRPLGVVGYSYRPRFQSPEGGGETTSSHDDFSERWPPYIAPRKEESGSPQLASLFQHEPTTGTFPGLWSYLDRLAESPRGNGRSRVPIAPLHDSIRLVRAPLESWSPSGPGFVM
jgi:hypothetical protein